MLPTSGALQLKISGAASERPSTSQQMRVFEIGKPRPFRPVIVEQVPQPFGARLLLEVLDQRRAAPIFLRLRSAGVRMARSFG